jgi:quercetin dioxygenase-like cupin family protein
MIVDRIDKYTRGWFVGDFDPSIHQTKEFEVGVLTHKKGEKWASHYHKQSREINLLLEGSMLMHGIEIHKGSIFVLEPWEVADPIFLEDCKVLVIKTPSIKGDKYEVVS